MQERCWEALHPRDDDAVPVVLDRRRLPSLECERGRDRRENVATGSRPQFGHFAARNRSFPLWAAADDVAGGHVRNLDAIRRYV